VVYCGQWCCLLLLLLRPSSSSSSWSLHYTNSLAAIDKQKNVDTYKSYNYEYTLLKAFDNKAATDARNAGNGADNSSLTKSSVMGSSARKLAAVGGSMRKLNMKQSRAQSVYIRGI
jgi:hypothetical protein